MPVMPSRQDTSSGRLLGSPKGSPQHGEGHGGGGMAGTSAGEAFERPTGWGDPWSPASTLREGGSRAGGYGGSTGREGSAVQGAGESGVEHTNRALAEALRRGNKFIRVGQDFIDLRQSL
jgi:hypothetical protein